MATNTIGKQDSGGGGTILAMDAVQADTIARRDSSGDIYENTNYAAIGLRTAGHLYAKYLAENANFTTDSGSSHNATVHGVTTAASTITATLESAASAIGKILVIEKVDSGVGSVVVDPSSTETLGGTTIYALYNQYDRIIFQSDGSNWNLLVEPTLIARAVAASTAVTASAETTFDTSGQSIAANTLRVGDILEIEAQGIYTSTTGSETGTIKLKLGTTVIVTTGALDVATGDIFHIRATIQVRTIGASGTMVASGVAAIGTGGATTAIGVLTAKPFFMASTTIDTTAATTVNVTSTNSSTGESVRLDVFTVKRFRN